ncbi:MAG: Bax inhibitor-1/YccA family protein [Thermodesulfobacteriota bacterium]
MAQTYPYSREIAISEEAAFFRRVYNWMVAGLALTGGVAWFTAASPTMLGLIFGNPLVFYVLIGAELIMVWVLAARVGRMAASTATTMFLIYSILNGLTMSAIFLAYARTTIASAFLVSAGTFAAMSVYGFVTKRSLQSWGGFLTMGLIGIIIASVVNIFVHSQMMDWLITYVGVLVFVGLTAYDTQKLRVIHAGGFESEDVETKAAVMGALALYLDFINLFLMILRIMGGRRN